MSGDGARFETLSGPAARAAADALAQHAFQSEAWVAAVAVARGRRHRFVAVRALGGEHAGACLFGGVHRRYGIEVFEAMPMAGYGGWCADGGLTEAQEAALNRAWLARAPWWVAVLTGMPGREQAVPSLRPPAWLPATWRRRLQARTLGTHVASLEGDDAALLQRARPKARNHLRRVDHSGYAYEINGPDAASEFCRLFRAGSADWKQGARALMPDAFFHRLHDGGVADVWRVRRDGHVVAAALFLKGRCEIFYQASGTLRAAAGVSAIDALLWTAMRHYRDLGFRTLNMGASDGLDSVRFFKEKLGALPSAYRHASFVLPRWLGRAPVQTSAQGPA